MVKKGDTLIEVVLAVGIFAMVAISIVAVMSGGMAGAQSALETTLAREEIDAQAEALRFIQAAYVTDKDSIDPTKEDSDRYQKLWKAITDRAIVLKGNSEDANVLQYQPVQCADLYDTTTGQVFNENAFIINYRNLGNFTSDSIGSVMIPSTNDMGGGLNTEYFSQASTYPRIVYTSTGSQSGEAEEDTSLATDTSGYKFYRAEGIYVIAVKDKETTTLDEGEKQSAFYDFYIRTCWYGTDANQPSTISTVIRLYDPDALSN